MAEDIASLLSPSAISRVSSELPRHDEPPRRQKRQPRRDPDTAQVSAQPEDPGPEETPIVGSHLNVRA